MGGPKLSLSFFIPSTTLSRPSQFTYHAGSVLSVSFLFFAVLEAARTHYPSLPISSSAGRVFSPESIARLSKFVSETS